MSDRILSFIHPSELRLNETNPRSITPDRLEALRHALRESPDMLLPRPIIVDVKVGDTVGGNHRLRVINEELANPDPKGKSDKLLAFLDEHGGVPVYFKEFTSDAERREWLFRDNNPYADWVPDEVASLVKLHEDEGGDMSLLGFGGDQLKDLLKLAEDDPVEEPDAPDEDFNDQWGVVIECDGEQQQAELLEEFTERGLNVRALVA